MALQILELLKMLPRTNCGACGYSTCMAFATHVLREGEKPSKCCHFEAEKLARVEAILKAQEEGGITAFPGHFVSARKHVISKIQDYDLEELAPFLGAEYGERDGRPGLVINLLQRRYEVTLDEVVPVDGPQEDVWEHVLLYNYIAGACREPLKGNWVAMGELPGALAKQKGFGEGCEEKIAAGFGGRLPALKQALGHLGAVSPPMDTNAEFHAVFYPLPRVPFLLYFWDEDRDDGFPAKVKILFDATVLCYLDIESLVFLGEKTAQRLLAIKA
ncbi:MAG: DUF3786 domain-containing protein [Deltaproteobacteria bacterium]|nr:DUF3786 domain-containing protein [Candidatus Anaeroferrophillus wilburensis]MBN2887922.1 DUF3786 domain-containing protein [Deltaproteobacteria bacterium]